MDIASILELKGVVPSMHAASRRQAFQQTANYAANATGLEPRDIAQALMERERLGSTGVGHGVAIPHARFKGLKETRALFVRLAESINFEAVDDQPVDLMFILLAPEGDQTEHLRAMARVSRLLRDKKACEKIRAAVTPEVIYSILTAQDEAQENE